MVQWQVFFKHVTLELSPFVLRSCHLLFVSALWQQVWLDTKVLMIFGTLLSNVQCYCLKWSIDGSLAAIACA